VTHIRVCVCVCVCVYFPLTTLKFHTIAIFLLLLVQQYFTQNSYVRLQFMIIQNSTRLVTPLHSLPLQHWKLSNLYTRYLYTCTRTHLHTNTVQDNTPVTFYSPKYNPNTIKHNVNIQQYVNIRPTVRHIFGKFHKTRRMLAILSLLFFFSNVTNTLQRINDCHQF